MDAGQEMMRLVANRKLGSAITSPNFVFAAYSGTHHSGLSSPMPCA
jgi:hypothetical protein